MTYSGYDFWMLVPHGGGNQSQFPLLLLSQATLIVRWINNRPSWKKIHISCSVCNHGLRNRSPFPFPDDGKRFLSVQHSSRSFGAVDFTVNVGNILGKPIWRFLLATRVGEVSGVKLNFEDVGSTKYIFVLQFRKVEILKVMLETKRPLFLREQFAAKSCSQFWEAGLFSILRSKAILNFEKQGCSQIWEAGLFSILRSKAVLNLEKQGCAQFWEARLFSI